MDGRYILLLFSVAVQCKCELIQMKQYKGVGSVAEGLTTTLAGTCLFMCEATPGCISFDVVDEKCVLDAATMTSGFAAQMTCTTGWYRLKSSCYKVSEDEQSWSNADANCVANGGHLITVRSSQEQRFVASLVTFLTGKTRENWIGGTISSTGGSWEWRNGEPWDWVDFQAGQPDNYGGVEHCLHLRKEYYGSKFNDAYCDLNKYFVCEM